MVILVILAFGLVIRADLDGLLLRYVRNIQFRNSSRMMRVCV